MKFTAAVILSFSAVATAFDVPSLTPDNYDELTQGKAVFIKFFAPWCGHCKKMKPDWEQLAQDWAGSTVGLVAEVDCTGAGKPLCEEEGVRGFPTIKYGDPADLEDYQGSRAYDDLSEFAEEVLKPLCSPTSLDLCDEEKKKEIEAMFAMSEADLDAKISEMETKLQEAEKTFEDEVQKLQDTFTKLNEEKDAKIAAVKDSGLGLLKSVKAVKAKDSEEPAGDGSSDEL